MRIVDAFWDLRDDAFDHPDRWDEVTAEGLFQRLAECVEEAEERAESIDWRRVAERMIAWRNEVDLDPRTDQEVDQRGR